MYVKERQEQGENNKTNHLTRSFPRHLITEKKWCKENNIFPFEASCSEYKMCILEMELGLHLTLPPFHLYFNFHTLYTTMLSCNIQNCFSNLVRCAINNSCNGPYMGIYGVYTLQEHIHIFFSKVCLNLINTSELECQWLITF